MYQPQGGVELQQCRLAAVLGVVHVTCRLWCKSGVSRAAFGNPATGERGEVGRTASARQRMRGSRMRGAARRSIGVLLAPSMVLSASCPAPLPAHFRSGVLSPITPFKQAERPVDRCRQITASSGAIQGPRQCNCTHSRKLIPHYIVTKGGSLDNARTRPWQPSSEAKEPQRPPAPPLSVQ